MARLFQILVVVTALYLAGAALMNGIGFSSDWPPVGSSTSTSSRSADIGPPWGTTPQTIRTSPGAEGTAVAQ